VKKKKLKFGGFINSLNTTPYKLLVHSNQLIALGENSIVENKKGQTKSDYSTCINLVCYNITSTLVSQ